MIIPEKEKGVKSFQIPGIFIRSMAFVIVLGSILFGILMYDYWQILQQIHENKHLGLENRQLRKQIQLFQMKVNSLAEDIQRIKTFEEKLSIITGVKDVTKSKAIKPSGENSREMMMDDHGQQSIDTNKKDQNQSVDEKSVYLEENFIQDDAQIVNTKNYQHMKLLYDQKIAANFGITEKYKITRKFSKLIQSSFELSEDYSLFDYKFKRYKTIASNLEKRIHVLDQHLLNNESILRSTPTVLPTNGWITSYFGHRISPTAGVRKMHEGLDVGAPFGTPIIAPADGVVTYAGKKAGFGMFVQIDHGYGIETIYAHSRKIIAKNGQKVKRGDLLATVGSTGYSTGPHLHYEVRVNGIAVDPLYFILD